MPTITAYHVSRREGLDTIKPNVCDDSRRDGHLYGARVACFTTTLYHGERPTISPYPRAFEKGEFGYRYVHKFDPDEYDKFLMASSTKDKTTQVHFLLLKKNSHKEKLLATVVRWCLRSQNSKYDEEKDWNKYFRHGKPNDSAHNSVYVNVMFMHNVQVRRDGTVEKRGPTFSGTPAGDGNQWIEKLLEFATSGDSEVDDLTAVLGRHHIRG